MSHNSEPIQHIQNVHLKTTYKVYKIRWVVLLACMILISNVHMAWLTFTPVQYKAAQWIGGKYADSPEKLDIYGIINFPIAFLFGFVGAWLYDEHGSYTPLMLGGWSVTIGNVLRCIALYTENPETRYFIILAAQIIFGISIAMLSLAPAKIASVWFAEDQRALANTAIALSLPGGIMVCYVIGPIIVNAFEDLQESFSYLFYIYTGWGLIGTLLVTIFMRNPGVPKSPASPSSLEAVLPYWQGLKSCFFNLKFWLICAPMSCGMGVISIVMITLPEILCPFGFTESWANTNAIAIMISSGCFSSFIFAVLIDKYGNLETFFKVLLVGTVASMFMFSYFATIEPDLTGFGLSCALLGVFAYPILPIGYELSVETTFPVGPATSAGLNWIISSLMAFVLEFVFIPLRRTVEDSFVNQCAVDGQEVENYDYRNSLFAICAITGVCGVANILFYKCPYERRKIDDGRRENGEAKRNSVGVKNSGYE